MNVDFITAIKMYFANYANFRGRSTRAEYWWAMLFVFLVGCVASFLGDIFTSIVGLALIVPNLAILTRRFHDAGKSGWWVVGFYIAQFAVMGFSMSSLFGAIAGGNIAPVQDIVANHSGSIVLGSIIMFAIGIWMIVICCTPSKPDNQYGPNPYGEQ